MAGKKIQSYRDLEIWKMARELVVPIHKMTLEKLPKFEMINNFRQSVIVGYVSPDDSNRKEASNDSEESE